MVHSASSFFATRSAEELKLIRKGGRHGGGLNFPRLYIIVGLHRMSAIGTKQTLASAMQMSAFEDEAGMMQTSRVKLFQFDSPEKCL